MIGLHHDIPAARYHADDFGDVPTLSSSIAKILLDEAPIKAKMAHPRLWSAPPEHDDPSRVKEIGTAAHKLILGRGGDVIEVEFDDYRKADAKEARRRAYADGHCPILSKDLESAIAMASAVREKIGDWPGCSGFLNGSPEVVVLARDHSGAALRIMIDMLEIHEGPGIAPRAVIWDVKTGDTSAAPHGLGRRIEALGMELQAEFYRHVLGLARPDLAGRITHRWLFVENEAPHLFVPAELDAAGREMGRRKVGYAIDLWNRSLGSGEWPGYPPGIVIAEYPAYAQTKWLAREDAYETRGIAGAYIDAPPGWIPPKQIERTLP